MHMALHQDHDGGCFYCGGEMFFLDPGAFYDGLGETEQRPDVASEDHVIPVALGGTRHRSNVVIAHRDCNSIKGNTPPSPAMLERLAILNERRGFLVPDVPGQMQPNTFFTVAETSKAMFYLCDLLNAIEGVTGQRARNKLAKRLDVMIAMRKSLRDVKNEQHRLALLEMFEDNLSSSDLYSATYPDHELLNTLTKNITKGMVKREKEGVAKRKQAETQARKAIRDALRLERRQAKREAASLP